MLSLTVWTLSITKIQNGMQNIQQHLFKKKKKRKEKDKKSRGPNPEWVICCTEMSGIQSEWRMSQKFLKLWGLPLTHE